MSLKKSSIACVVALSILSGSATTAMAAEEATPATVGASTAEQSEATFSEADNGRALSIELSDGAQFESLPDGSINVIDDSGQVVDTLPETATNAAGEKVNFSYSLIDSSTLKVDQNDADGYVSYGWWDSWGRCTAGVVGGTGGGALAGAGVGTTVPVIGTTIGGVVGGVSGGLTGAAASC